MSSLPLRWHVLGAGALGSLWSARLARAGQDRIVRPIVILKDETWLGLGRPSECKIHVDEQHRCENSAWSIDVYSQPLSATDPIRRLLDITHSTAAQYTMAKNTHDETDMFTTARDTPISIDDECDDDCVMMTGVKRVTTTTTETAMTKREKRVSSGTAHSNEAARHPLRRPPHEAQSAAEAAGKQPQGHGSPGASRMCPNESPYKSLADDPKAVAAFKSLFQQPGLDLLKARNAKQREKGAKRAAEKRAKQIQETAICFLSNAFDENASIKKRLCKHNR